MEMVQLKPNHTWACTHLLANSDVLGADVLAVSLGLLQKVLCPLQLFLQERVLLGHWSLQNQRLFPLARGETLLDDFTDTHWDIHCTGRVTPHHCNWFIPANAFTCLLEFLKECWLSQEREGSIFIPMKPVHQGLMLYAVPSILQARNIMVLNTFTSYIITIDYKWSL